MGSKRIKKIGIVFISAVVSLFIAMVVIAKKKKDSSVYGDVPNQKNVMEGKQVIFVADDADEENADGVKGHLESVGDSEYEPKFYEKYIKRVIDLALSFGGLVLLSPVFACIALAIVIDDPGPVMFTQKRIGKNKQYFKLHKFRSMKMSTPHDVPTHMLEDPERYITRVGGFLRKHSLDELPQIWDIFVGNMSVIGPRPALWNQDVLVAERDKFRANDVKPGLTGWAQINGRDELEIVEKARLDGEYVRKIGIGMDIKCFLGSTKVFAYDDSVVEGSTEKVRRKMESKFITSENILVSVIIATYKREASLYRALLSLAAQTYKNIEVVLVDDNGDAEWNSKVQTIVDKLEPSLNINYIVNKENIGSAAARNKGITEANGKYISFLDDDDIYLPLKIEMQIEDMLAKDADYGITDLYLYNQKDKLVDRRIRSYIKSIKTNNLMRYHLLYHMTGTDTLMFKTEYIRSIGGFPGIDIGDEFYLMKEAIFGGGKLAYSPHCYVKAYIHSGEENGLSSGVSKIKGEKYLFSEKKKYYRYLTNKDIKYIEMRHYAVIAFAEFRRKNIGAFVENTAKALFTSPVACVKLLLAHK